MLEAATGPQIST